MTVSIDEKRLCFLLPLLFFLLDFNMLSSEMTAMVPPLSVSIVFEGFAVAEVCGSLLPELCLLLRGFCVC